MLIRSMDGPLRVLTHLTRSLRTELDKTARDLQEEFPITETGVEGRKVRGLEGGKVGKSESQKLGR